MIYVLLLGAIVGVLLVALYNSLVKLKNKCDEAWADIDTQLKRRYDLIPNLVETVKGYASHEAQTLEKVVQARNTAMNAQSIEEKEQAENMISGALKSIFALAEQYPDLKANQNFLNLQQTLQEIEEHLQLSRRYYNATVRDFNTKIQVFPNNLIAKPLGFNDRAFFQATEGEKENVKVSFSKEEKEEATAPKAPAAPEAQPSTPAEPAAPAQAAPEAQPAATAEPTAPAQAAPEAQPTQPAAPAEPAAPAPEAPKNESDNGEEPKQQ